jgi:hypothetical protein
MPVKRNNEGMRRLREKLKEESPSINATIAQLLTDEFIKRNTDFDSFKAFLDASGIKTVDEIGSDQFNSFIAARTRFDGWEEMYKAAAVENVKGRIGI